MWKWVRTAILAYSPHHQNPQRQGVANLWDGPPTDANEQDKARWIAALKAARNKMEVRSLETLTTGLLPQPTHVEAKDANEPAANIGPKVPAIGAP